MKKVLKPFKSKVMLQIALFAALFGVMDVFIEMKKKTEEQTTYSVTLEDLLHAQTETDGEAGGAGGGGADGEDGGGTPGGGTTTGSGSDTTFAYQPGKRTKNVFCFKKFGLLSLDFEVGYRDKCRPNGSGCRPTRCL